SHQRGGLQGRLGQTISRLGLQTPQMDNPSRAMIGGRPTIVEQCVEMLARCRMEIEAIAVEALVRFAREDEQTTVPQSLKLIGKARSDAMPVGKDHPLLLRKDSPAALSASRLFSGGAGQNDGLL